MIYIVLGMHKSGTTLVSEILHKSGIHMGDFDMSAGYDEGNKYERLEPHDLNIEMLGYDYDEFSLNILKVLEGPEQVKPETIAKMKELVESLNRRYSDWGFKDPRTCLTYSVWKSMLPKHKLVIVFRNPMKLWQHYKPKKFYKTFHSLAICWKAVLGWYVHNLEILKILKSAHEECIVLLYADIMQDDRCFKAFSEFIGRPLHDSRNPALYRNKTEKIDLRFRLMLFFQKHFFKRDVWGLSRELSKYAVQLNEKEP